MESKADSSAGIVVAVAIGFFEQGRQMSGDIIPYMLCQ